jgi:hypothetical protein
MALKKRAGRLADDTGKGGVGNQTVRDLVSDLKEHTEALTKDTEALTQDRDEVRKQADAYLRLGQDLLKVLETPPSAPTASAAGAGIGPAPAPSQEMAQQFAKLFSDPQFMHQMQDAIRQVQTGVTLPDLAQKVMSDPVGGTTQLSDQVAAAEAKINFYTVVAGGTSFLPFGFGFASVFATQILMLRDIAQVFGTQVSHSLATDIVIAGLGTAFEAGLAGRAQLLASVALPRPLGLVVGWPVT